MKKTAFSVIEISITLLIIGVLLATIAGGKIIVNKVRLEIARSQTRNSIVTSIKGLGLWLEPTLKESFIISETADGEYLTKWYDINTQSGKKNNFSTTAATDKIQYKNLGINNLPSVLFNGGTNTTGFTGNALNSDDNKFTLFVVFRLDIISAYYRNIFFNGTNNAWRFQKMDTSSYKNIAIAMSTGSTNITSTSHTFDLYPEITTITHNGSSFAVYDNGTLITLNSSGYTLPMLAATGLAYIGRNPSGSGNFYGLISEIIYYERLLSSEERQNVEKYLSKKYNITVS